MALINQNAHSSIEIFYLNMVSKQSYMIDFM